MEAMVRAEYVMDSWKTVRKDTVQAVLDFPAGEFDYRPQPELMTFGEIARHILEAGHILTGNLLDGVEDLSGGRFRESFSHYLAQLPPYDDAAALATVLDSTLGPRLEAIAARGEPFLGEVITRFDGQKVTRLELLQFTKEHELTHRAQLFMYLRLKGIVPATTRRRNQAQAARS
jgi:uncharacterized damage-inducible protein DinB